MTDRIGTPSREWDRKKYERNLSYMLGLVKELRAEENLLRMGGGEKAIERQHRKGRLTARERIERLIDPGSRFFELGIFAAWGMYEEYGTPPAAGLVMGIGKICGRDCVIIANDATVKAGAYFEVSLRKSLRAQRIALENNLPIIYLVDSAGVFLPLQDQVFPDEAHFGRIFFNNARMSALGIPQIAAVMGPCVAGGAYLPVMCDKFIMTEGSSLFLAGPALVKAAIGQEIDEDTLGGATTHNAISGTADYHEPNDEAALKRIRLIVSKIGFSEKAPFNRIETKDPYYDPDDLNAVIPPDGSMYDVREILARIVDDSNLDEYKKTYGKTLITGTARIGGFAVGIVANQKMIVKTHLGEMQMGGVIYSDSADKAARFIMNCNQEKMPIIFFHDVNGFMVGRDAEWGGIAKDGAKMVNAVSNSVVPKFTVVLGGSYGAGNYAMSGRAYEPRLMLVWPTARIAVMGGSQAANTLAQIRIAKMKREGKEVDEDLRRQIVSEISKTYEKQSDPRYAAARMWVDAIIEPAKTREYLIRGLEMAYNQPRMPEPRFGVLQV